MLDDMCADGRQPALIFYDYLQRIPGSPGKDRSLAVSENLETIKDLALRYKVPSVVGVQAKREVDTYTGLKIPAIGDGQWSSNVEQTSDKAFGFYLEGKKLYVRVLKQKWGPAGRTFTLDLDPALGILTESVEEAPPTEQDELEWEVF